MCQGSEWVSDMQEAAKEPEGEEEKKEGDEEKGRSSRKRSRGNGFGGSGGQSIESLAEAAVRKLNALEPKLELAGQTLQFIAHREQVAISNRFSQSVLWSRWI